MLEITKSNDCSLINICGDDLESAFNSSVIEKITVKVTNGCNGSVFKETLNYDSKDSIKTDFTASDTDISNLTGINVSINNVVTNILSNSVVPSSEAAILAAIDNSLIPFGVNIAITVTPNNANYDIVVNITNTPAGFTPVTLVTNSMTSNFTQTNQETIGDLECQFVASIPTNEAKYISTILYSNSAEIAPVPGLNGSFNLLLDQADMISSNALGTLAFETNGDVVDIIYTDIPDPTSEAPHSVLVYTNTGILKVYTFVCQNLTEDQTENIVINPLCYCSPTTITSTPSEPSLHLKGNCLSVLPSLVGQSGKFADGIYKTHVVIETTTEKIMLDSCVFMDCDIKCIIANIKDVKAANEIICCYQWLVLASECGTLCSCEDLCNTYNELLIKINNALNPNQLADCEC